MAIRDVFEWLATRPKSQYTLGEMIFGKGESFSMQLNRGGRIVERATTAGVFIAGAIEVLTANTGGGAVAMAFSKNAGMYAGLASFMFLQIAKDSLPRKPQAQGLKL